MRVSDAHVYSIIGHNLPEGEPAPDGIELYTKELVNIQLDLQELEQHGTELSIDRFGAVAAEEEQERAGRTVLARLRDGFDPPDEIRELEAEYQSIQERIAGAREAMVSGHVSHAGVDPSEYSDITRRELHKWVDDGTFPEYIRELETAADRVGHRLAAKRETANVRTILLVSLVTLGVSALLVVFAVLSLIATLL